MKHALIQEIERSVAPDRVAADVAELLRAAHTFLRFAHAYGKGLDHAKWLFTLALDCAHQRAEARREFVRAVAGLGGEDLTP